MRDSCWLGCVVFLAACGSSSSKTSPDASPDAPALRTVTGTVNVHYVTPGGDVTMPFDLSALSISALVPPTFQEIRGTTGNGSFTIASVPEGDFYLKLGTEYIDMTADTIDLSFDMLRRADAQPATFSTTLSLDLMNLAPWQATDELEMVSAGAGTVAFNMQTSAAAGAPMANDTSLTGFSYDLTHADVPGLVDGSKGDQLIVAQLSTQSDGVRSYDSVSRAFTPAPFTLTNGGSAAETGAFDTVMPASMLTTTWDRPAFAAEQVAHGPPSVSLNWSTFAVTALPEAAMHGFYGEGPDVLFYAPGYASDSTAVQANWPLGDPFPADWTRIVWCRYYRYRFVPFAGSQAALFAHMFAYRDLATVTAQSPLEPIVGEVLNPQINGMDALGTLPALGTSPAISWSPPALGTANRYYVRVQQLVPRSGGPVPQTVAAIETSGTQVVVPPGLLVSGNTYVFEIEARSAPGIDLSATPLMFTLPEGIATLVSSPAMP